MYQSRRDDFLRLLLSLGVGLLLCGLAFWQFDWLGTDLASEISHGKNEDWDWQLTMYEVTRLGVVEFGELPTWNPFTQGGVPLLANPEFPLFYPPFVLIVLFGTTAGIKLWILFHTGLLVLGCYIAGREIGLSRLSSHGASIAILCSAFVPAFIGYGHIMFLPLGWLPLAWVAYRRGAWHLSALALSLSFLAGGHYLLLYGALWIGLDAFFGSIDLHRAKWLALPLALNGLAIGQIWLGIPILAALILAILYQRFSSWGGYKILLYTGLTALLLLGVKLATAPSLFERAERLTAQTSTSIADACPDEGVIPSPPDCYSSPVVALSVMSSERERFSGHEGQNVFYSSWPVVLGFIGIVAMAWINPSVGLIGLLFWSFGWGGATPVNLLELLHRLPGFDHIRVVERYSLIWTLFVGWGCGYLADYFARRRWVWGVVAGALALWWIYISAPKSALAQRTGPMPSGRPVLLEDEPFRQLEGDRTNFEAVRSNQGKLDCWTTAWLEDPAEGLSAVGRADYRGEAWLMDPSMSVPATFTTSEIVVTLPVAGEVIINQNWYKGWSVDGHDVGRYRGLLSANLTSGEHTFTYRPPGLFLGLLASFFGVFVVLARGLWPRGVRPTSESDPQR